MKRNRLLLWSVSLLIAWSAVGCANFRKLDKDLQEIEARPRVYGKVVSEDWSGSPIVLVLMRQPAHPSLPIEIVGRKLMREPGAYEFRFEPGVYMLGAFEDVNGDQRLQVGEERVGLYRDLEPIDLTGGAEAGPLDIEISDEIPAVLRDPDLKAEVRIL